MTRKANKPAEAQEPNGEATSAFPEETISLARLSKDLKAAAKLLTPEQARYLVDTYYQIQQFRINARGQERAAEESREPHGFVSWTADLLDRIEASIKLSLDIFSEEHTAGRWAKRQMGVGPVLAAGLLAHIDPQKARTTSGLWRFAGLDPTQQWNKKEKRPWNAKLKVLAWKLGESFVKVHNKPEAYYGKVYADRKEEEIAKNAQRLFADQARAMLQKKNFSKDTKARQAYQQDLLPDGHIHARAKRYAVKLFLAHYFQVAWESTQQTQVPKPYVIGILGHAKYLAPPYWDPARREVQGEDGEQSA